MGQLGEQAERPRHALGARRKHVTAPVVDRRALRSPSFSATIRRNPIVVAAKPAGTSDSLGSPWAHDAEKTTCALLSQAFGQHKRNP